jgi:hypothetical protein
VFVDDGVEWMMNGGSCGMYIYMYVFVCMYVCLCHNIRIRSMH